MASDFPWNGREILCRGAVLPYHELSGGTRLTDDAWLERLDEAIPEAPAWLRPILSDQPVKPPAGD